MKKRGRVITDKAKELAEAIRSSNEYSDYLEAREALEKDDINYEILEEFRQKQWEIQLDSLLGRDVDYDESDEVDEIYTSFIDNDKINEFLLAEYKFTKVLNDVQEILLNSLESTKETEHDVSLH